MRLPKGHLMSQPCVESFQGKGGKILYRSSTAYLAPEESVL